MKKINCNGLIKIGILSVFLSSCTIMEYRSKNAIPIYLSPQKAHLTRVQLKGQKEFYLWGLYPQKHIINVDIELSDSGVTSAAKLRIKEFMLPISFLWSIISFGFYIPKNYEIEVYGIKRSVRN